jgi:hypothetical protein
MRARGRIRVLKPAQNRWRRLSIEDRIVLLYALRDAMRNPKFVADYASRQINDKKHRKDLKIHEFRIGFASFTLRETATGFAIYDFWLYERRQAGEVRAKAPLSRPCLGLPKGRS